MSDLERPLPDHGTRSRYVKGCECFECAEANRIYAAERARRTTPVYRSAGPARDHIRNLMAAGVGLKTIVKMSGVSSGAVSKIVYGDRTRGRGPSQRIRPATHERIMSVTVAAAADGARIDAGPTWKLIDEMTSAGVPKAAIAREIGQVGPGLQLGRRKILAGNARKVADVHARWMTGDLELRRSDSHGRTHAVKPSDERPTPSDTVQHDLSVRRLYDAIADAVNARDGAWRQRAQCRSHPTWMFYPARGDHRALAAAKAVCRTCPVQPECTTASQGEPAGVWAGVSAQSRTRSAA